MKNVIKQKLNRSWRFLSVALLFFLFSSSNVRSQCPAFSLSIESNFDELATALCDVVTVKVRVSNPCPNPAVGIIITADFPAGSIIIDMNDFQGSPIASLPQPHTGPIDFASGEIKEFAYSVQFTNFDNDIVEPVYTFNPVGSRALDSNLNQIEGEGIGIDSPPMHILNGNLTEAIDDSTMPEQLLSNTTNYFWTKLIDGEFRINVTGDYFIQGQSVAPPYYLMSLTPGSRIVVEDGAHLILNNVALTGCEEMWRSIVVENGGELSLHNCYLQDGTQAIKVESGGIANIIDCRFQNNLVGLDIRNGSALQQPSAEATIQRNIFEGAGNLKAPYENQISAVGITAMNIPDLHLPSNLSGGNLNSNIFRNMRAGIRCRNTNLLVDKAIFQDIQPQNSVGGQGIDSYGGAQFNELIVEGAEFNHCFTGVSSDRNFLNIHNTTMNEMNNGIQIENALGLVQVVRNNKISASDVGVHYIGLKSAYFTILDNKITMNNPSDPRNSFAVRGDLSFNDNNTFPTWNVENNNISLEDAAFGIFVSAGSNIIVKDNALSTPPNSNLLEQYNYIYLDGTQHPIIACNSILGNVDGKNFRDAKGITINSTPFAAVECNTVAETEIGIDVIGMSINSGLKGNKFGNHQIGLQLGPNAIIGEQNYHGNRWTLLNSEDDPIDDGTLGAVHEGLSYYLSKFTVDDSDDEDFMPSLSSLNLGWFESDTEEPNFSCPNNNSCGFVRERFLVKEDDKLSFSIIKNKLPASIFEDPLRFAAARQLYRVLLNEDVQGSRDGLFDYFLNEESSTTVSQFYNIEKEISDLFAIDPIEQEDLIQFWETVVDNKIAIKQKKQLINQTTDPEKLQLLIREKKSLESELVQASLNVQNINNDLTSNRDEAIDQVLANNQAISTETIYESNQKTVTDIFLKTMAIGISPTTEELDVLHKIANQCPFSGGEAVYQARAMVQGGYYNDELLCAIAQQNSEIEKQKERVPHFTIFPNPSQGKFMLTLPTDVRTVTLSNTLGQVVQQWTDMEFPTSWQISNLQLPTGTYYCTIETLTGSATQPIVIIK